MTLYMTLYMALYNVLASWTALEPSGPSRTPAV